ncbi:hypothetical protein D9758_008989 [Tetrapyrgos nigripes]|uniref:Glycoside hydrolase family 12 protein n=1 Tax=Tetrapyrgos nigripes TaxID=182062 RepID=A0A8H5GKH6_9AGAR|nr:hypothetical protein D9758_008989 [Tetrapyrgos nigripes]
MFAKLSAFLALFLVLPLISTAPTASIDTSQHCGQWDQVNAGTYTLFLDQWGLSGASSGSDCAALTSMSGNTIAWKNTWTWNGGNGIKSYTNIQQNAGANRQLSAIQSIPATLTWSQSTSGNIVANVAFDLFTSNSAGGSAVNEIMIWLANINAGPISAVYNANGQPQPVASGISLAGHTWNLYQGSNGANNVFSFLPSTSGTQVTNFSGDIKTFLNYLTSNRGMSSSQFLTTLQVGTEATSGSATLTVSSYNVAIN